MLETKDILETINMIDNENLDVRTITMGISLLDCIDEDIDKACDKVYDKICRSAKDLVKTAFRSFTNASPLRRSAWWRLPVRAGRSSSSPTRSTRRQRSWA